MDDSLLNNPEARKKYEFYKEKIGEIEEGPLTVDVPINNFEARSIVEYVINKKGYNVVRSDSEDNKVEGLTNLFLEIKKNGGLESHA